MSGGRGGGPGGPDGPDRAASGRGELIIARDPEALAALAAEHLARLTSQLTSLADAPADAPARLHVGLAGGRTPRRCYELLAQDPRRPAARWEVWLGDERCVPPDDAASNFGLLQDTLIDSGALPAEHAHRVPTEYGAERAAESYELVFPARLDVLVLGMGADGHTASLFPGSPALEERRRRVVAVAGPRSGSQRVTITPPVIAAAGHVLVLVSGDEKAAALARALDGPLDLRALPAQLARHGTWIVDGAAAAQLRRGSVS